MRNLYLDLDGLGSDWQGYVLSKLTQFKHISELNKSPERERILSKLYREDPRMFYCLPKIDKYQVLLDYARANFGDNWFILSAGSNLHPKHNQVKADKRYWLADMFEVPITKTIVVRNSEDKLRYANGNILVDDFDVTCEQWNKAGGFSVYAPTLVYDPERVIAEIELVR